jgi:hypothetical protein
VNVVAVVVVLVMLIPVYIAQRLAGGADGVAATGAGGTGARVEPLEGAEP